MLTTSIVFGLLFLLSVYRMRQLQSFVLLNLDELNASPETLRKSIKKKMDRLSLTTFISFTTSVLFYAFS